MENDRAGCNGNEDRRISNRLAARGPCEALTFSLRQDAIDTELIGLKQPTALPGAYGNTAR